MPTTDHKLNSLVINKLTREKYNELAQAGLINDNELYCVTNSSLDAGNQPITNVATPVSNTDAANKAYVDSHGGGSAEIVNFNDVESGDDITSEMFNKLITPGTMIYRNNTIYTQIELYPMETDEDGYSWGSATYACAERTNHFSISIDGWNEEEWSTELFFDVAFNSGKYDADLDVVLPPTVASGLVDTEYVEQLFATGRCAYYNDRLYTSAGGGYGAGMGPDKLVLISRDGTTEYRLEFHAEGTGDNRVWYVTPTPIVTTIGGGTKVNTSGTLSLSTSEKIFRLTCGTSTTYSFPAPPTGSATDVIYDYEIHLTVATGGAPSFASTWIWLEEPPVMEAGNIYYISVRISYEGGQWVTLANCYFNRSLA